MTTTPPWGTPAQSSGEPVRPARAAHGAPVEVEGRGFVLIVEQLTGTGDAAVWRVEPSPLPSGPTRQAAREAALDLARTFAPQHPFSVQGRNVYRVDDDTFVVLVSGLTKTFHFRVSVAERLG